MIYFTFAKPMRLILSCKSIHFVSIISIVRLKI